MRVRAVLVLLLAATTAGYDEKDFICPTTNKLVPSILVCDGTVHCPNTSGTKYDDESSSCVPAPYLKKVSVVASEVAGTSVLLFLSGALKRIPDHPLKLAGYFLTGMSKHHRFQHIVQRYLLSHKVEWLKPSTTYTFILRPFYTDDGDYKFPRQIGRATSVEILTLSADHFEISVEVVNSTAAVVTWLVLEPGKRLVFQLHEVLGDGEKRFRMSKELHGMDTALSTYTVFIGDLNPWTYYLAAVEDCSAKHCKQAGNRTFITPPDHLPNATVTRIESRRPGSFDLEWAYPQDSRPYDGFRVRYCKGRAVMCSLVFTNRTSFTVDGLEYDTVYHVDVRAQFKIPDGRFVLGPLQTASVVTWSNHLEKFADYQLTAVQVFTVMCSSFHTLNAVPVLSIKHEADVSDLFGTSVLSWTTPNSSVGYMEYRLDAKGPWTPCNESPDCNVTVDYKEPEKLTSGIIVLRHYRISEKVNVDFRGCNIHGCGKEFSVKFTPRIRDPAFSDASFDVLSRNYTAVLRLKDIGDKGFEVDGRCGDDWEIHYEKSMHDPSLYSDQYIEVKGLPFKVEECEFFMRTYKTEGNITHYNIVPVHYLDN